MHITFEKEKKADLKLSLNLGKKWDGLLREGPSEKLKMHCFLFIATIFPRTMQSIHGFGTQEECGW